MDNVFVETELPKAPGMNKGVPDFAQKIVQRYASGNAIDVRFNPKRPGESVLEPRVPKAWIFALVIAVALLILSVQMY